VSLLPLWQAVHDRLSSGKPVSSVRVGPMAEADREALADLLGLAKLPGEYVTVSMAKLADAVGDVRAAVVEVLGPLDDRAARRARVAAERTALWHWLETHEVVVSQPALAEWAGQVRRAGVATRALLDNVLRVLRELPADGIPLPTFADALLGDAHGLDDGTRESGLVLRALATVYGTDLPANAAERRALWEQAGIADDALSAVVLAAGLALDGDDVAPVVLRACAESGHAAALTLAQLRASTFTRTPPDIWIVENPSVLAVALSRPECPPLVCVSGWPNSAAMLLLRRLSEAGSTLHYHGDFDGEGLRIAAHVMARTGARPWRMSTADYLAALTANPTGAPVGRVTEVPWDAGLATALRAHGTAVAEERVTDGLLRDISLDRHGDRPLDQHLG
jgi:uncharacterized protein (TIGR02679 family)